MQEKACSGRRGALCMFVASILVRLRRTSILPFGKGHAMHYLNFDKARMLEVMAAIRDGLPVAPSRLGWTGDDMMHVAAGMLGAIMSQGPMRLPGQLAEFDGGTLGEAVSEDDDGRFGADVTVTLAFAANLALLTVDGNLPDDFGDIQRFAIQAKGQLPEGVVQQLES